MGAGAVGATLGGLLALRAGADVALVARGAHLEALRARGLRLEGVGEPSTLRLRAAARLEEAPDVLILATKLHDLDAAAAAAAPVAGEATVPTVQNGLQAEAIASRRFGAERVVGAAVALDALHLEPGRVRAGSIGGLVLGRPGGAAGPRAEGLAALLASAGIPARTTANFAGARWMKLLVNLNNALPAVTGMSVQELYAHEGPPRVMARLLREGLLVARAEGVRLEPLPWASPRLVRLAAAVPEALGGALLARRCTAPRRCARA